MNTTDQPNAACVAPSVPQPDADLASTIAAGSLLYPAIWILVILTTPVAVERPWLGWPPVVGFAILGFARLILCLGYPRWHPRNPIAWRRAVGFFVLAVAGLWGGLCAFVHGVYPIAWSSFLCCVSTAALVAGGAISLRTHRGLQCGYLGLMLLPCMAVSFGRGGVECVTVGGLLGLELVFMLVLSGQLHQRYRSACRNAVLLQLHSEQLDIAREKAEEADRAKSLFLANMSHEIRTPMNAIVGSNRLLQGTRLTHQQRVHADRIQAASASLLQILSDLLDIAKIEAGKLRIDQVDFELHDVLQGAADLLRVQIDDKGLRYRCHVGSDVPSRLVGDPSRLHQVLVNLLGNAVKFTDAGEISVWVQSGSRCKRALELEFSVRDTGIGMTPDQLGVVFQAFSQADVSHTRRHGGVGLGLAISKHLVERMGGVIDVDSTPGCGSTFRVRLPLGVSEPRVAASSLEPAETPAPEIDLSGRRLLVAEDNEINACIVMEQAKHLGMDVTWAIDGLEAVELIRQQRFDVILMDIQMPVLDGLDATRRIRELPAPGATSLPIIAMTAHVLEEDVSRSLAAGMNDHLAKPINPETLSAILAKWLDPALVPSPPPRRDEDACCRVRSDRPTAQPATI